MRTSFEVEVRQAEQEGYEPSLVAVMLTEGRAASGGRAEVFAPLSVTWPGNGIGVLLRHRGPVEVRAQVTRQRNGELSLRARATDAIRAAVDAGRKFMSVEFRALEERTTKAGVREILSAFVPRAALVDRPEYDVTSAEVRSEEHEHHRRRILSCLL